MRQNYDIKTNFLEYRHVYLPVKKYLCSFKANVCSYQKPVIPNQLRLLCKSTKGNRDFYNIFNRQNIDSSLRYYFYSEEALQIFISEDMWKQIFRTCFKSINNKDLLRFQYSIQHFETILHLLIQCREVKIFWRNLRLRIQYALNIDFDIKPSSIIFGRLNYNSSKN